MSSTSLPVALLDVNVLYPAPLRDTLMHLAVAGCFRAWWSAAIHEEWIRNLLRARPDLPRATLESTRDMMQSALPTAGVSGYQSLIPILTLPDPDDRHVLAAAIKGWADVIVTFNLKDFPASVLAPHNLRAKAPDDFLLSLWDADPNRVVLAMRNQRALLKKPPKTVEEHLQTLEDQRLPRLVARLRERVGEL